jgi:RNA polymerase sigma factor (TIGR02999 family)
MNIIIVAAETPPPPIEDTLGAPIDIQRVAADLVPLFYADLRRVAHSERLRVSAGHTMQTTALIHEAYLRLCRGALFNDRLHFLRASALAMRHALVNHARERSAEKRGGGRLPVPIDEAQQIAGPSDEVIVEINDALLRLASVDSRLAQVVECRFFAGYDETDTAGALGLTDRTVRRDWVKARAWLRRELARSNDIAGPESV